MNETKNHNPPFKLNGRSLMTSKRSVYDFHIDTFIYKRSAAIIGYCGLLTPSECVPFLLSSKDNACDVTHDIASMI